MSSAGKSQWDDVVAGAAPAQGTDAPAAAAPSSSGSWWKAPAYLGSKIAQGALGTLGLPGDIEQLGFNALSLGDPRALAMLKASAPQLPTSAQMEAPTNYLGVTNNPSLEQGRSLPIRLLGGAAQALPAAAADVASGGALTPALVAASGAGVAGEAAHEIAPNSTWAPIVASVLGGYSASRGLQGVQAALGTHDKIINGVLDSIAPGVKDFESAGKKAQAAARDWLSTVPPGQTPKPGTLQAQLEAIWSPVKLAIPDTTQVDLTNFQKTLNSINTDAGRLEPVVSGMKPAGPKVMLKKLNDVLGLSSIRPGASSTFDWSNVQAARTVLGDALSSPTAIQDVGAKNLDSLYAALTADMSSAAKANGAGNLFDSANKASTSLYDQASGSIGKLVKGKVEEDSDPLPGAITKKFLGAGKDDSKDLAVLRAQVPEAADAIASAAIRSGKWSELLDTTKDALLPPGQNRATIDAAMKAKALASEASGKGGVLSDLTHGGVGLALAELYNEFGPHIANALGIESGAGISPEAAKALGFTAGYVLPKLTKSTGNIISDVTKNPASRRAAAVGAIAGPSWAPVSSNALNAGQ